MLSGDTSKPFTADTAFRGERCTADRSHSTDGHRHSKDSAAPNVLPSVGVEASYSGARTVSAGSGSPVRRGPSPLRRHESRGTITCRQQDGLVSHLATQYIGDRGTLLEGVAYSGLEHNDGAVGRGEQAGQMDLLQRRLPVWPYDDTAHGRQHHGRT